MTALPLSGRHALVTGASQGIGSAIVMALAAQGASVSLLGRRAEALREMANRLSSGTSTATVVADVADATAVAAAFDTARGALGPIHVLVNNAGQAATATFSRTSIEVWQRMLDVNLTGTFLCTQAALPDMVTAGWGRIINIASSAGLRGYAYASAYAAAKHGVIGLTRSLALEVVQKGITVNAVCPGYTDTEILHSSLRSLTARTGRTEGELRAEFAASNTEGRILQPEEVADVVLRLCREDASTITGQAITEFGGGHS
jgi:NAD(P)-dependent dehydrogenase (short-subunit alcohol dehydrogenase family)